MGLKWAPLTAGNGEDTAGIRPKKTMGLERKGTAEVCALGLPYASVRVSAAHRYRVADRLTEYGPTIADYDLFSLKISSGLLRRTVVSGGTDSVSQTFPPMTDRAPIIVDPPNMVAFA